MPVEQGAPPHVLGETKACKFHLTPLNLTERQFKREIRILLNNFVLPSQSLDPVRGPKLLDQTLANLKVTRALQELKHPTDRL